MARLSQQQVQELIKAPRNKEEINKAIDHDLRLRLHTEPIERTGDETKAHREYFEWVQRIVKSPQKLERFKQFCTVPLHTNELTDSAFKEYENIFKTTNSYKEFNFSEPELQSDWLDLLRRRKDHQFWTGEAFQKFKTAINSFIVVDVPTIQIGDRPSPYWYTVDMQNVIDADVTIQRNIDSKDNDEPRYKVEYLIFKDSRGMIIALDDEYYRVYKEVETEGADGETTKVELVAENPHDLGQCPARQLWTEPYSGEETLRKKGPISTSLGALDLIQYNHVAESFGDSYIPLPVITKYREKCNYIEPHTQMECVNGMVPVHTQSNPYNPENPVYQACPVCSASSEVFAGTTISVDPPETNDQADQIDAVKFVQPSTEGLRYMTEKNETLEKRFIYRVVGKGDDFYNGQARNEKDVESRFESRETILRNIARNFEAVMQWTYTIACRLRYAEQFESAHVFLGDQYFLHSVSELNEIYKQQKENGYPEFQLSLTRQKIIQTKYKDDPNALKKAEFLSLVEPLQGKNLTEINTIRKDSPGVISDQDYEIKINFDSFVKRFEVEVMPINTLLEQVKDEQITIERAITEFNQRLISYANE